MMAMAEPRPEISVLIANFNNGAESSVFGTNLIVHCLESIRMNIGEGISWECLVWDDGSTDSGLATVRAYGESDGRFRLFEGKHVGRVGEIYNRLVERATGRICVRMDGDTVTLTEGWGKRILWRFDEDSRVGMIGPVQVWDPDDPEVTRAGRVRCFRCWLWTPRGRRNPWRGKVVNSCAGASGMCDYVSGSWVAFPRKIWEEGAKWDNGYRGRGEDLDWFVRARSFGYSCYGDAGIVVVHRDTVRVKRGYRDRATEVEDSLRFEQTWGFHHYFPDRASVVKWGTSWRENAAGIPVDSKW